ncbi:MAG: RNA polymerase Rpb4 [Candidatus Methylarchaceae archaeon HK02M1]|nr:RNA polymerase Rpb4 [Candidatus Methylarchaceae archaeon HK02M1]
MTKVKKTVISTPEAKEILEKIDIAKADQIQKRTLDYVTKFSKTTPEKAKEIREKLVKECSLTDEEATELVNIMPKSIEETRVFTSGWKKLLPTEDIEKILKTLSEAGEEDKNLKR